MPLNTFPTIVHMRADQMHAWENALAEQMEFCKNVLSHPHSYLEWLMTDILEERDGKVSISGRTICNLRFATHIDGFCQIRR